MRLVENSSALSALLHASWQDRDLQRLPALLCDRMTQAAACPELGGGREARSAAQAATLLGSERVRHIALWHVAMGAVDEHAATEFAHAAGHALQLAPSFGLRPCKAITLAIGGPLGWRLLTLGTTLNEPLQRVLRDAARAERTMLEQMVFGSTSEGARAGFVQEHALPDDLAQLIRPTPGSPELLFREAVWASLQRGATDDVRRLVRVFAEVMLMRLQPWSPPRAPDQRDVALAIAELVNERDAALSQVDLLEARVAKLDVEVDLALNPPQWLAGPGPTHACLKREVDRARRYKRDVSIVALGVDRATYGAAGDLVMREIARRVEARYRGSDFVGMIDAATLVCVLPETNLAGARIFSERVEHDLRHTPLTHEGCAVALRARLYCTTLAQEQDPTASGVLRTALEGLDQMDPASRVGWNGSGRLIWRVAP